MSDVVKVIVTSRGDWVKLIRWSSDGVVRLYAGSHPPVSRADLQALLDAYPDGAE